MYETIVKLIQSDHKASMEKQWLARARVTLCHPRAISWLGLAMALAMAGEVSGAVSSQPSLKWPQMAAAPVAQVLLLVLGRP
jgi:hypothetical protein